MVFSPSGFHSVVVLVESLGPSGLSSLRTGYWLYGWLSDRFRATERELGSEIHSSRALTVSPLLDESRARMASAVTEGGRYAFRISFLRNDLYAEWDLRIWPGERDHAFRLGPQTFRLLFCTEDPHIHPLAGQSTADDLLKWGREHSDHPIRLQFLTPTVFKATQWPPNRQSSEHQKPIDIEIPLPDPDRIISSLAGRWQRFAPPEAQIPEDHIGAAKVTTAISRFSLRAGTVQAKDLVQGFAGWAEFRSLAPNREVRAAFATLFRFAGFSGVGSKTALGLGMVHLLNTPSQRGGKPRIPGLLSDKTV